MLRREVLFLLSVSALTLRMGSACGGDRPSDPRVRTLPSATPAPAAAGVAAHRLAAHVNEARRGLGLARMTWDEALGRAAARRVGEVVVRFSHARPKGTIPDLLDEHGVFRRRWAENLAAVHGRDAAEAALRAHQLLLGSAGHRANILHPELRRTGVGVTSDGSRWTFVQLFAG